MACLNGPTLPVPTLPGGLSIAPPIPPFSFDLALCCKLLQFAPTAPPISFGVALNPAIQTIITQNIRIVQDFIDSLPLDCPRE